MTISKRTKWAWPALLAASLALALATPGAAAEPWPNRPVRLIVTLGPGSGVDISARLFAENVARDRRTSRAIRALGWQQFVVWECQVHRAGLVEGLAARIKAVQRPPGGPPG